MKMENVGKKFGTRALWKVNKTMNYVRYLKKLNSKLNVFSLVFIFFKITFCFRFFSGPKTCKLGYSYFF